MVERSLELVCLLIFFHLGENIGSGFGQLVSSTGSSGTTVTSCSKYDRSCLDGGPQYDPVDAPRCAYNQFSRSCSRGLPSSGYCDSDDGLPCTEMFALRTFISSLGLAPAPSISRSYCSDKETLTSISIVCTCEGVVCHITAIIMQNLGLSGSINPAALTSLIYLTYLDLSFNELHGSIPDNLDHLTKLEEIHLDDNQLTGAIPKSLGNLTKLTILHLHMNFLSENIPPSLGNLTSLVELNLQNNKLSGEIPRELGNLSQLQLKLDENQLSGELPQQLGNLRKLQFMTLTSNKLSGKLPKEFAQLGSLVSFQLGGNDLTGPIPSFIEKWTNLTYLILVGNNFEGEVPAAIFNMRSLKYLMITDLRSPSFEFPKSANLSNIATLILRKCSITGPIPTYVGKWSWLRYLDLSFNSLIGGIPDSFENLSLNKMLLTGNMLNGTVPGWINDVVHMGDLSYNNFPTFPEPEPGEKHHEPNGNFKHVESIGYPNPGKINVKPENRSFINQIMDEKCDGKRSKYHSLYINAGGGETTIEGKHYAADNETSNFYISPKDNWGYSCSGDFTWSSANIKENYIKNISCGVSVPEAPLYEKSRLCPQSLTYYGFCLHKGNYTVKLHFVETVYAKDEDHSSSGKRIFDIYIQGRLEKKDFNIKEKAGGPNKIWTENFTADVHDNLLEIGLYWAGKGSLYNTPNLNGPLLSAISVTPDFEVGVLSRKAIAWIAVAGVTVPILLLGLIFKLVWVGDKKLRETMVELRGKHYPLKMIKDATRSFTGNKIGEGRFGTVYKADLGDQVVAVKRLNTESKHVIEEIGTELYVQQKPLRHENLVELLGRCSIEPYHLLIYEYMGKSSLQQALSDPNTEVKLDWPTRVRICLGIAKGLKHLHEDIPSRKVVHRDIKPSNILLDEKLNAKVTDFGLAKIYEEEDPIKYMNEKGTAVYMAPEYAKRLSITEKVDVFSFGILLLEIVSGKTCAESNPNQETSYLLDTAMVAQDDRNLMDLIDKNLSSNYTWQQAEKILALAMRCINQSYQLRPKMSEVVNELDRISKLNTQLNR